MLVQRAPARAVWRVVFLAFSPFFARSARLFGANRGLVRFFSGFSPIFPGWEFSGPFGARKCEARGGVLAAGIRRLAGVKRSAPIGA